MKILGTSLNFGTLAAGAGIVLLTPIVVPIVAGILKPVAKSVIKGGLIAYEKSKTATAEAMEGLEDLAAEAKSELSESQAAERKTKKVAAKGAKA